MARQLDQILAELNPYYSGSESTIQNQLQALPGETDAGVAGLDAKLSVANDNILSGARRRGLGFSGIPVGEQAQYAATDYAPALANYKSAQTTKALTLNESLNQLVRDKRSQAQGIYDNELTRDQQTAALAEQQRQFNENLAFQKQQAAAQLRASQSAGAGAYLGGGAGAKPAPAVSADGNGGWSFTSADGKPITAAQYAKATSTPVAAVIQQLATKGDASAKTLYNSALARYMYVNGNKAPSDVAALTPYLQELGKNYSHILGGV